MEQKGYYSLIQFLPDLSRQEGVNIGVLLYAPENQGIRVRTLKTNKRISQFFGKQDWAFVESLKNSLVQRLSREFFADKSELEQFMAKRANSLQLTGLQPLSVRDLDEDIEHLFQKLVAIRSDSRKKRIDRYLGERLSAAGVRQLVQKSVSVHFPFFDEPVRAPYGYQNGRFNLITPINFTQDLADITSKAGKRALEGKILFDNPDRSFGKLCLNVVAQFPTEVSEQVKIMIRSVLVENQVKFYDFDDLNPLVKDIQDAARAHAR